MRVDEIMTVDVRTATAEESANAAYARMRRDGIHHLVVMNGDRVEGVLSERDLGGRHGEPVRAGRTVGELMTEAPVLASPTWPIREAANLLRGRGIGCLPVVENGELKGILTAADVCGWVGKGRVRTQRRATIRNGRRFQPTKG